MNEDYYILPNLSEPVNLPSVPLRGSIDIYEEIASGKRFNSENQIQEPKKLQQSDSSSPGKSELYLELQSFNGKSRSIDIRKPSLHQNRPLPHLPSDGYDSSKSQKTSCKSKIKCSRIIFTVLGLQTVVIITLVIRLSTLKSKSQKTVTATTLVKNITSTYNDKETTLPLTMHYSTTKTRGIGNITSPTNGTTNETYLTSNKATTNGTTPKKKGSTRRPRVVNSTEKTTNYYTRN